MGRGGTRRSLESHMLLLVYWLYTTGPPHMWQVLQACLVMYFKLSHATRGDCYARMFTQGLVFIQTMYMEWVFAHNSAKKDRISD